MELRGVFALLVPMVLVVAVLVEAVPVLLLESGFTGKAGVTGLDG